MITLREKTTASHRPAIWLPILVLSQVIDDTSPIQCSGDQSEPIPSEATRRVARDLITEIPVRLLGKPEISPFYGEIHVQWELGNKQIILMCFPDRTPLVHHYLQSPNTPSEHGIEIASGKSLVHWLKWLRS